MNYHGIMINLSIKDKALLKTVILGATPLRVADVNHCGMNRIHGWTFVAFPVMGII
jgi:hypothetical protein